MNPPANHIKSIKSIKSIELRMKQVKESVEIGSVQDAIYFHYIDTEDVLRYLVDKPLTSRTLAAYRSCCCFAHPNTHLVDGIHFLNLCPIQEYQALFLSCGGHQHLFENPRFFNATIDRMDRDLGFQVRIRCVCGISLSFFDNQQSYDDLALNRSFSLICSDFQFISNKALLENENLVALAMRDPSDYADDVVNRILYLSKSLTDYWTQVASDVYFDFVSKLLLDPMRISKSQLKLLADLWPKIHHEWWINLSDDAFNILSLESSVRAYVLGFPVHCSKISKEQILNALRLLTEDGLSAYVDKIRKHNESRISACGSFDYPQLTLVNKQDTILVDVVDYSPADVICYQQEDKLYCFTRPEFDYLLREKINPWTKDPLPESILFEIETRQKTAENYPPSQSIFDLLTEIFDERQTL